MVLPPLCDLLKILVETKNIILYVYICLSFIVLFKSIKLLILDTLAT